ncbi:large ribosomal subunit protein eL15-like [Lepus europaeus]|uniref:large ribosomal subunit protein eL15-like n=1 Tax=Lepus europaeus TaxID=9983 RepID=UPI002B495E2E|nr:large ribosomal subunit protein eL15-like [Lepus europaeus]
MGVYKYIQELWRKKQLDGMHFLLRCHCWQCCQLSEIHRAPCPTQLDKVLRVGYKAKHGYIISRIHMHHSGPKCPAPNGATYGMPVYYGMHQLKFAGSFQCVAEERTGCHCGALRVLNSYGVGDDSTYNCFLRLSLWIHSSKAIQRNPDTQWITKQVDKHREMCGLGSLGHKSCGLGKGHVIAVSCATWRRQNTLQLCHYR